MSKQVKNETYNGWTNYETWNVALWLSNDKSLYQHARRFRNRGYSDFVKSMNEMGQDSMENGKTYLIYYETPDRVSWNDSNLDIEALDEMIKNF